ncbi:MAG: hypothetical protein UR81_C0030G0005 [Candidatus Levybacteria bacterium GW2011_GWB1_35_5]|nr:MAG: hypothetical protein UR81_C0030G0005 [Candidatus Levybacteria bacterium GW2011_GWB1_35_5]
MKLTIKKLFNKINKDKYDKYLELMPDFKKEKTQKFTTVVLTLIAIIILAIFAINPTLSTIANLQKQLEDARFVADKLEKKINNLSILQTKYNAIQPDLPTIYDAIPKNTEAPKLTGQIQSLITKSEMQLINIQVSNIVEVTNGKFYLYNFDLTTNGDYQSMTNFLENLINMQRVTDVKKININLSSTNNTLQFNVQGDAFFKK